nr:carbamoyltransferase HypF [Ammoniphilus resinae]
MASTKERRQLLVSGTVQGVGFRPLVYRVANKHQITGSVCNQLGIVSIEVEGTVEQINRFIRDLEVQTKEPAKIESIEQSLLPLANDNCFRIKESKAEGISGYSFPPDLAVCSECISDLTHPSQRYYNYPFTSCSNCGPRYSIIQGIPYDRPVTTMKDFSLCEPCRKEYEDPSNRRFHAQTIACPTCGPIVELRNNKNVLVSGDWKRNVEKALLTGKILAVKGIGGFHLICDAASRKVVEKLRNRKRRARKPFALIVRDLQTVEENFELTQAEQELLASRRAPIVLLRPKPFLKEWLPLESLAPGYQRLGVMLPYTPMHALLFTDSLSFLVATSGNQSGLPIARTNEEALQQLDGIADYFLLHNREIGVRVEDSVCQVVDEQISFIRRSRGYVPESIPFPLPPFGVKEIPTVLAVGAEMKNTACILHGDRAILSQHLGEIEHEEQLTCWREGVQHIQELLRVEPEIIAYDPHPGYIVTQQALDQFQDYPLFPIYHHHAHMAACMAEHGLISPVIGCILDGTGYGRDGNLWGFEILTGDYLKFERACHLEPLALPGGEAAIRYPWMMAMSLLYQLEQDMFFTKHWALQLFPDVKEQLPFLLAQLDGRIPCPRVSSAGRLFDAVAALLGICVESTYDGEAAVLLGERAEMSSTGCLGKGNYSFAYSAGQWRVGQLIKDILGDLMLSVPIEEIAKKFHHTVVEMVIFGVLEAYKKTEIRSVVLSGGVWNNRYLLSCAKKRLKEVGFTVYTHQKIPAGDGGIALGQAVSALWRWHHHVFVRSSEDH